jgi:hypothetical protein
MVIWPLSVYWSLYLCLAMANILQILARSSRVIQKVFIMQLWFQSTPTNLMHNHSYHKDINEKIKVKDWVGWTGACLDYNNVSILATWHLWTSKHPLDLLLVDLRFWLHVIYRICRYMSQDRHGAMHEVQNAISCMNRSNLNILAHKSYFTNLPIAFLFINKATTH